MNVPCPVGTIRSVVPTHPATIPKSAPQILVCTRVRSRRTLTAASTTRFPCCASVRASTATIANEGLSAPSPSRASELTPPRAPHDAQRLSECQGDTRLITANSIATVILKGQRGRKTSLPRRNLRSVSQWPMPPAPWQRRRGSPRGCRTWWRPHADGHSVR